MGDYYPYKMEVAGSSPAQETNLKRGNSMEKAIDLITKYAKDNGINEKEFLKETLKTLKVLKIDMPLKFVQEMKTKIKML